MAAATARPPAGITNIAQAGATDPQSREIAGEPASATVTVKSTPKPCPPKPGYGKPADEGGHHERTPTSDM